MKIRAIKILEYLINNGEGTAKNLAEKFSTTERTIYYDFDSINEELEKNGLAVLQKEKKRIYILPEEIESVKKFIDNKVTFSAEERKIYLCLKLLYKGSIKLSEEIKILQVKRNILENDLKEIKESLQNEPIKIYNLPGRGIILEGNEISIRNIFFLKLYLAIVKRQVLRSVLKELVDEIYEKYDGDKKMELIYEISNYYEMNSTSFYYLRFLAVLIVGEVRLEKGKEFPLKGEVNQLSTSDSYLKNIITEQILVYLLEEGKKYIFLEELLKKYQAKVDDLMRGVLIYFITKSDMNYGERIDLNYQDAVVFSEEFKKYNDIDIWDCELLNVISLRFHRGLLKFGCRFLSENRGIKIEIPPNLYPLYMTIEKVYKDLFGKILDAEVRMLTMIINARIEEHKAKQEKTKKILIGDFGIGTTLLDSIMYKLSLVFNIEVIKIISVHKIKNYIADYQGEIDYIFIFEDDYHSLLNNIEIPTVKLMPFSFGKSSDILFEKGFTIKK